MKKPLLDVVFMSEKRKEVLLLLRDEAKEMEFLLKSLNTTRQALLPQIRILEEHHLVSHDRDIYELTTIGKLVVDEMVPLLNIVEVLDVDIDYWGTHDLEFLPPHLLERIDVLKECSIMSLDALNRFEAHNELVETSTKNHFSITTFFYPNFLEIFSKMLSKNIDIHVILSQSLFDKVRTDNYGDIKKLLSNKLVHFYVYPQETNFLSFVFSENYLLISPLKSNGEFDSKHVVCINQNAIDWAREVFEYYLKEATPVTQL
jgi:predicted transcriptional regulator